MDIIKWVLPLYGVIMMAFGLYIFVIGLWGLAKKRPLILAARQLMWFIIAMYIPATIQSFIPIIESWGRQSLFPISPFFYFFPVFQSVIFVLLVIINMRQMTGYLILGVSDETFQDSLTGALKRLNLPFEVSISKVKLIGINADLQVAVASWVGSAQIRIQQAQQAHYAKRIANAMDVYFHINTVKVVYYIFIVYLILGILMMIFVVVLGAFAWNILFRL